MRVFKFFLIAFAAISGYSCNQCNYLDCAGDNYYGQFRIISSVDGKDLVFGQNAVYNKNYIRFYSIKDKDTIFFDSENIKWSGGVSDSMIQVKFLPKTDTAFMRLSDGDVDTLAVTFKTLDTKCCGNITEISNFRFNNKFDLAGSKGVQSIKK